MLSRTDVMGTVAVKSLAASRRFYEDVLGLEGVGEPEMGVQVYRAGQSMFMIYESEFAGTNKATSLTWSLGERLDETVRRLRGKGVDFERYDMPGAAYEDGVHVVGQMRLAWFKDPDGNIIHIGKFE